MLYLASSAAMSYPKIYPAARQLRIGARGSAEAVGERASTACRPIGESRVRHPAAKQPGPHNVGAPLSRREFQVIPEIVHDQAVQRRHRARKADVVTGPEQPADTQPLG